MMTNNIKAIQQFQQKQIHALLQEKEKFGNFQNQFQLLQSFRQKLKPFYRWKLWDRFVGYRNKKIKSGDFIDHHITAYFVPFCFQAKSWGGGGARSPVEHIIRLSNAFKTNQTRFIYVSLPLKLSVYPELVARDSSLLMGASTLPQFRQMHLKLLQKGVEVIDVFPIFMKAKQDCSIPLFDLTHNISQEGARIIAQAVADYIKETTDFAPNENLQALKETAKQTILKDKKPYIVRNNSDSPFCIFGNCNLQAFHGKGSGIASNLAFYLQHNIDYLGRKLIFWGGESENFDKETFQECCKREIAICISFLTGSFVRTSAIHGKTKKKMLWDILRGKQKLTRKWSTLTLEP